MGGGRGVEMEKSTTTEQQQQQSSTHDDWENEQQKQQQDAEDDAVMVLGLTAGLKGRPPRNNNKLGTPKLAVGRQAGDDDDQFLIPSLLDYESNYDDDDIQVQQQQETPNNKNGNKQGEEDAKLTAAAVAVQQVLNTNQFHEAVAAVAENIAEAASTLLSTTTTTTTTTTTGAGGGGGGSHESEKNSSSSVYLDKDQGTWKCRHCIWTYRLEGPGIDLIQNPKVHSHQPMNIKIFTQPGPCFGLESTAVESAAEEILANEDFNVNVKNSDILKSLTNGISNQSHDIIQEKQTGLHLLLAEKPSGNRNTSFNFDHKDEHSEITTEIKPEVAEWDIERVIAEQDTHDLFCPNCKSCITKRVILRKRKRNDKNIEYGTKPKKTESLVSGSGVDPYAHETDDQGTIDSGSDVTRHAVGTNDQEHDTGPDVFRCLSCFSFFIPTVSGFKLFRIFGAKDKGEKLQSPQQTPDANVRTRDQGDNATQNVEEDEVQALNRKQYPSDQKDDQVSLKPGASLPNSAPSQSEDTANSATQKSMEAGKDFVLSPNQGPILVGGAVIAEVERPDGANETKNADVKKNSISSVATAFLFLGKSHVNGQMEVSIGENMKDEKNVVVKSVQGVPPLLESQTDAKDKHDGAVIKVDKGDDLIIIVKEDPVGAGTSHSVHDSMVSAVPEISPVSVTEHYANQPRVDESRRSSEWDILKSIVYGGLVEAITSLGVVSSAAGGNATTVNILALALANLVSGLIIVVHGIRELKYEQYGVITDREDEKGDRYLEVLGWRKNYWRHAIVAVLSYLVLGLLPPLVYAFSFYKSNNKEYKMICVAAVSLIGIMLLAIGKAHVQKSPRAYSKTILYYLSIGVTAAGLSFLAGQLIIKFLDKVDWFEPSGAAPVPPSSFIETISGKPAAWAYY